MACPFTSVRRLCVGIREYWIINLNQATVEVHLDPQSDGRNLCGARGNFDAAKCGWSLYRSRHDLWFVSYLNKSGDELIRLGWHRAKSQNFTYKAITKPKGPPFAPVLRGEGDGG